jgi:hypothetical protein
MANKGHSGIGADGLEHEGPVEFTLSGGEVIRVYPISYRLYQAIENRYRVPEPPTKAVPTIDGGTENIPDPQNMEYVKQVEEIVEAKAAALIRLVAMQSLPEIKVDRAGEWVQVVQLVDPDYVPPEDAVQLKVDYLQYWLIRNRADWELLMMAAIASIAMGGRDIEKAMASFRGEISREIGKAFFDAISSFDLFGKPGNDTDGQVGGDTVDAVSGTTEGGQSRTNGGETGGGIGGVANE